MTHTRQCMMGRYELIHWCGEHVHNCYVNGTSKVTPPLTKGMQIKALKAWHAGKKHTSSTNISVSLAISMASRYTYPPGSSNQRDRGHPSEDRIRPVRECLIRYGRGVLRHRGLQSDLPGSNSLRNSFERK